MLKNLPSCYNALSFLRPHCSNMLSFFINFFLSLSLSLSLSSVLLLPKPLLSPLSLLLYHTISPKFLLLPLTISDNSFTIVIQKILERTPLQSHINPTKKLRKNPITITQKPNQKNQKISTKKTQNLIEIPKKKKKKKKASKTQ